MARLTNKQRRQERAKAFAQQKVNKARDFNFDQYNRKGVEGTHVSGQEARTMAMMNNKKNGGQGVRDSYAEMQRLKESGATFSKRAEGKMNQMGKRIERMDARAAARKKARAAKGSTGQPTNPVDETTTGQSDSVQSNNNITGNGNIIGDNNNTAGRDNNTGTNSGSHTVGDNNSGIVGNGNAQNNVDNTQTQTVTQDNDINTTVTGDNNTTITNQDNSVRNYGGDNRSFVYNSSGGDGGVGAASAATMAGFYDVDDSPAAQAQFNDMYKDFNKGNSNRFAGQAMETLAMFGKTDARDYTPEAMENTIGRGIQYSYDKADEQTGHVFGDIWNDNYITENWKMPTPPKEIKSEAAEIADDAKEDIEDV